MARLARRLALVLLIALLVGPTEFGRAVADSSGRDVSFPQCANHLPRQVRFGVIGVNGGASFTSNPCLAGQLGWAKSLPEPPAFYANTGNPGPAYSTHWPIGQWSPRVCSAAEPNSLGCSYDYGWNSAQDSFAKAMDGAQALHHYDRVTARQRVANVRWWLDVEILNSWQTLEKGYGPSRAYQLRDATALLGAVNALWSAGVQHVGIYSTRYQWALITGGSAVTQGWFTGNAAWLAGFVGVDNARAGCNRASFTGGPVLMTQYLAPDGFDGNVWCNEGAAH